MSNLFLYIAGFAASATLVIYSGTKLAKYGDIIAEVSGMGKAWFGLILMAAVTSLPELFTGVSAVLFVGSPDIAVGDIMGSCAFNLLILAILDYFIKGRPISSAVSKSHILAGFFSILLVTLAVIAIVFNSSFPVIGWFSSSSLLLGAVYIIAIFLLFRQEQQGITRQPAQAVPAVIPVQTAVKKYTGFALLVIAGALLLPWFADHIADATGLSKSFTGTLLVAATTSLPELTVSVAAVRMGSPDIAVGNLLGSNIFNLLILSLDDLLYSSGPILAATSPNHALSGLFTLLMTAIAGIGILISVPKKRFALAADAAIIIVLYLVLVTTLYHLK